MPKIIRENAMKRIGAVENISRSVYKRNNATSILLLLHFVKHGVIGRPQNAVVCFIRVRVSALNVIVDFE